MTEDLDGFFDALASASAAAILPHFRGRLAVEDKHLRGVYDPVTVADRAGEAAMFEHGTVRLVTRPRHTVHALDLELPRGRVVAVTGPTRIGASASTRSEAMSNCALRQFSTTSRAPAGTRAVRSTTAVPG